MREQLEAQDFRLLEEGAVRTEAKCVFGLVCNGLETVESARALIGITPRVLSVLRAVGGYSKAIRFRRKVLIEFEALLERSGRDND